MQRSSVLIEKIADGFQAHMLSYTLKVQARPLTFQNCLDLHEYDGIIGTLVTIGEQVPDIYYVGVFYHFVKSARRNWTTYVYLIKASSTQT